MRCRGYTLVELVASMGAMTVLLGGITSAVFLATRALPDGQSAFEDRLAAAEVAGMLAADLRYASSFAERGPTAVEFTVPDRTGDGSPEVIRYSWSGATGDPLIYQCNGGRERQLAQNVRKFDLRYIVRSVTETFTRDNEVNSGQVLLAHFDGWDGISINWFERSVSPSRWCSEYFTVDLPDNVIRLEIQDVYLRMAIANIWGKVSVAIHRPAGPNNPEPSTASIGTPASRLAISLPGSYWWVRFSFSDVVIEDPPRSYCIVIRGTSYPAGYVLYYHSPNAPADQTVGLWTSDAGDTWSPEAHLRDDYDIPFWIYGSYTVTATENVEVTRYFISGVNMTISIGGDDTTQTQTGIRLLNAPEVSAP